MTKYATVNVKATAMKQQASNRDMTDLAGLTFTMASLTVAECCVPQIFCLTLN